MKKVSGLILITLLSFYISGCKKLDKLTEFNLKYNTEFSIPGTVAVNSPVSIPTPPIKTSYKSSFENNNTNADHIERISLNTLNLTITAPTGQTFSFLNSIILFIKADGNKTKLASLENIPSDIGNQIELNATGEDLKTFVMKESFSIEAEVVTDETLLQDIDITAEMVFRVKAKLLK